jgi:hypothetical protein
MQGWRAFASIAACSALLGAAPGYAGDQPSCDWVNGIDAWSGSLSWTWNHHAEWARPPEYTDRADVQDAGGCTFELTGTAGFDFSGPVDGDLAFDDDWTEENLLGTVVEFDHTVLSGPIGAFAPGFPALMVLSLDTVACTYTFQMTPWADGMRTSKTLSQSVRSFPGVVHPGAQPIPALPGPLSFSGSIPVFLQAPSGALDPLYETRATAAQISQGHGARQDAPVSWIFEPGNPPAPANDFCIDAAFLASSAQQDTSFATSDASDPTPSCGGGDRSVWFFFFATASGTAQISTAGSGYPTVVSVSPLTASCDALAPEIACGADGASVPVAANNAYRVQIRRSAPSGTGALVVTLAAPEPGLALSCATALGALAVYARLPRSLRSSGADRTHRRVLLREARFG